MTRADDDSSKFSSSLFNKEPDVGNATQQMLNQALETLEENFLFVGIT